MLNIKENYYKAYDNRYRQVHKKGLLWELTERTIEVEEIIKKYKFQNKNILELGCGEGRDAIYLLNNNYNVLAVDYSKEAINKCNELTNNKYVKNFKQLDLITDTLDNKFNFIYSIAVLHMFVTEKHRKRYWNFIKEHLEKDGIALIVSMGDGKEVFSSNIDNAFDDVIRKHSITNDKILVSSTSCCIKSIEQLKYEINESGLRCIEMWISNRIPNFDKCICMLVTKGE